MPRSCSKVVIVVRSFLIAWVLLGMNVRQAHACANVTMEANESIAKLKEAERALDDGDVLTARELAHEVFVASQRILASIPEAPPPDAEADSHRLSGKPLYRSSIADRAMRLEALSYIRDRKANADQIEDAIETFETLTKGPYKTLADGLHSRHVSPATIADFGEALERGRRDVEAIEALRSLADRDLIGSAYAYAALSRSAARRGDTVLATSATAKCRAMAANPRACNGEYPPQPFLRGRLRDYALPGAAFFVAWLATLGVRRRRQKQTRAAPWANHAAPFGAGIIAVAAIIAFATANARMTVVPTLVAVGAALFVPIWQRRAFLSAVRRERVPGFHLRATERDGDRNAPLLLLFFGPMSGETLERAVDPSYRESARAPVLRLGRYPSRYLWIGVVAVVGLLLLASATVTLRSIAVPTRVLVEPDDVSSEG
jgi:hypothetical protein